jgi:hypothetical protein
MHNFAMHCVRLLKKIHNETKMKRKKKENKAKNKQKTKKLKTKQTKELNRRNSLMKKTSSSHRT